MGRETMRLARMSPGLALLLLFTAGRAAAQGQKLPTWDCQLKGACTYYHDNPSTLGCDQKPPECVPSDPGQPCSAQNVNIKGDVLVLDVNSMSYSGGPNHTPAVTTALECCQECQKKGGCNAWSFCWRLEGCGSGCKRSEPPFDPATGLGQFGSCAAGGKYPFRTCTLKKVPNPAKPELWDQGQDWTSGTLAA